MRNRSVAIVCSHGRKEYSFEVDNREFMCNLLRAMYDELPAAKK